MGRTPVLSADGLKRGAWTDEEDQRLKAYVQKHGEGGWRSLPEKAGLQRCGKSCRLRWANYLRPGIKRGGFTSEEDQTIIQLHSKLGNRWAAIARHLPKRTDNEIKNYWNAHLKKRLSQTGIDPVTHKPVSSGAAAAASSSGNSETMVVNAEDTNSTHNEITPTAQESEPTVVQQPTLSSRSTSASALLLNNLATRVKSRLTTFLQCVDPLRVNQTLQPMAFNTTGDGGADSIDITDINCHPDSSFQGNDASTTEPDTSDYWLDNISNPITTPLISPALSNTVLSQESTDNGNACDNANIKYPASDHASSNIVEDKAPESAARSCLGSQARVLNKVAAKFASLHCIDELHDRQNSNNNSPGPIQDDHNYAGGLSAGDINIDDLIFDDYTLGSPVFYNSNYLENELEPSDFFNIP